MQEIVVKSIILVIILIILFNYPVMADNEPFKKPEIVEFVDKFFLEKMGEHNIPGAAIVMVKDGEILISKGYGYANIEEKIPVDPRESVFRVASVSKIFTIVGVLQLMEQGLVDIEEDVNRYLTNFQLENNYEEPIRIKYLLTHTDGFETRDLATFIEEPNELESLEEILKKDLKSPVQKPGSMITYGGYGTALGGYLISQLKDVPFEDYIDDNIFKPLNMENSTFNQTLPHHLKEKLVTTYNYEEDGDGFIPTEFLHVRTPPTGALSTSAEDMGKFIIALLNKGEFKGKRILDEDTVARILNRQYSSHPSLAGVTYGFMESFYNGQKGLVRDGSGVGVRSQLFLLPDHNLGYFYVQNTRGDEFIDDFNEAFLDKFFPSVDKNLIEMDSNKDLKKFEGSYRPAQTAEHTLVKMEALAIGELRVRTNERGELVVTVRGEDEVYGGFPAESKWIEIEPLLFRRVDKEQYMAFQEDDEGKIISLTSGSGYHGSFIKISWYESNRVQLFLLIFYLLVFSASIIINLIKLVKGNRHKLQISGLISLLFLIGIIGTLYELFVKRIAGFPAFAFGVSLQAKIMLTILLMASLLSMLFLILFIKNWISNRMSIFDRILYLATTLSFMGIVVWLNYWNLLGYRY